MRPGVVLLPRRAGALAGLALAVALTLTLLFAAHAQAGFPGFAGKIAFDSDRNGTPNIYSVNNDGGALTQLTTQSGGVEGPQAIQPSWSADGSKIAYSAYDGNDFDIWVMNADGSDQRNLTGTGTADEFRPHFSFDGTRIVFEQIDVVQGDPDVAVIGSGGGAITKLTQDGAGPSDRNPVFSQDGRIYFDSDRANGTQIFVMNGDGSGQTQLTSMTFAFGPDPSPDAQTVAFAGSNQIEVMATELFLMGASGGTPLPLGTSFTDSIWPAFSPGTQRLAFQGSNLSDSDIALVGTGGGATSALAPSSSDDRNPDWQPIPYRCFGETPTIIGSFRNDAIVGTAGPDVIVGLGGNDEIKGNGGKDLLCGMTGRDRIFGGRGGDRITGGPGSDQLFGNKGKDRLFGGSPGAKGINKKGDRNKCHGGKGKDKAGADCTVKVSIEGFIGRRP